MKHYISFASGVRRIHNKSNVISSWWLSSHGWVSVGRFCRNNPSELIKIYAEDHRKYVNHPLGESACHKIILIDSRLYSFTYTISIPMFSLQRCLLSQIVLESKHARVTLFEGSKAVYTPLTTQTICGFVPVSFLLLLATAMCSQTESVLPVQSPVRVFSSPSSQPNSSACVCHLCNLHRRKPASHC